ncbi:MAG TPA: hypothetical protein PL033_01250 [Candidatus Brocadiia bacterium]|nr:hypothetical protein [Candidatus Brocadiia bacterium]
MRNTTPTELRPAIQMEYPLADPELRVLWPTTSGVTAANVKDLQTDTINDSPLAGWAAWLGTDGAGCALVTDYDTLQSFVLRRASPGQSPMLELRSAGLPAGKSGTTTIWIIPLRGMDSVSFAGKDMVASARLLQGKNAVRISWTGLLNFKPRAEFPVSVIARAGEKTIGKHDFIIPAGWDPAATIQTVWYWPVPPKGSYEIAFRAGTESDRLSAFDMRITEDGAMASGPQRENPKGFIASAIPEWKPEPVVDKVAPVATDGALTVFIPPGGETIMPCVKIDADLGMAEYYAFWFALRSGRLRTNIRMTVSDLKTASDNPGEKPSLASLPAVDAIKARIVENIESQNASSEPYPILIERKSFNLNPGENRIAALTFDSSGLPPGEYTSALTIVSSDEVLAQIPIRIRVHSVRAVGGAVVLGMPANGEMPSWDPVRLKRYFTTAAQHGCGGIVLPFDLFGNKIVMIRGTNRTLDEVIAATPDFLTKPQLPPLDFSKLDVYTDFAIYAGLLEVCVEAPYDKFASAAGPSPAVMNDPARIMRWYWGELRQYLRDKGYRETSLWLTGQLTTDNFLNAYIPALKELSALGWKPFATFTEKVPDPSGITLLRSARQSVWQWEFNARTIPSTALQQGLLAPASGDSIGLWHNYGVSSPWDARRDCWLALAGRKEFRKLWTPIKVREYAPTDSAASAGGASGASPAETSVTGNILICSPAWDAVRDGINDARYLNLLQNLSPDLRDAGSRNPEETAQEVLAEVLALSDDPKTEPLQLRLCNAREKLLNALSEFQKRARDMKPVIRWQDLPIVDNGNLVAQIVARNNVKTDWAQAQSIKSYISSLSEGTSDLAGIIIDETLYAPSASAQTVIVIGNRARDSLLDMLLGMSEGPAFSESFPGRERYVVRRVSWDGISGPLAERFGKTGRPVEFILLAANDDKGVANAAQNFKMRLTSSKSWVSDSGVK